MKLTIDRARWFRGDDSIPSLLRVSSGKMCCLGFLGEQCGMSDVEMSTASYPQVLHVGVEWPAWLFNRFRGRVTNEVRHELALINDQVGTTDEYKEKEITRIFAENGWEVEFVG